MKNRRYTKELIFASLMCSLGSGFTYGYNIVILVHLDIPLNKWLKRESHTPETFDEFRKSLILVYGDYVKISEVIFSLGCGVGSMLSHNFAQLFGRRGGLIMTNFICIYGSIFCGYSKYFESVASLIIGWFLLGVNNGINTVLANMYLIEIAPQQIRGQIASTFSLSIPLGKTFGVIIASFLLNTMYWPLAISLNVIPSLIQLIAFPFCPESPKYLIVIKGKELEYKKVVKGLNDTLEINEETLAKARGEYYQHKTVGYLRISDMLRNYILRHALTVSVLLVASLQLSGISVMDYYILTNEHTHNNGLYIDEFLIFIFGNDLPGIINLFIIHRISRRKLLFVTFIVMGAISVLLSVLVSYNVSPEYKIINYIAIVLYLVAYQMGIGSMGWFIVSEYFNTANAGTAYGISFTAHSLIKIVFSLFYIPFQQFIGGLGLLTFGIANCFLATFVYKRVPDTRNKTIKEVYKSLYNIQQKSFKKKQKYEYE